MRPLLVDPDRGDVDGEGARGDLRGGEEGGGRGRRRRRRVAGGGAVRRRAEAAEEDAGHHGGSRGDAGAVRSSPPPEFLIFRMISWFGLWIRFFLLCWQKDGIFGDFLLEKIGRLR